MWEVGDLMRQWELLQQAVELAETLATLGTLAAETASTLTSNPPVPIEITNQVAGVVINQTMPMEFAATLASDNELNAPISSFGAVLKFLQTYFVANVGRFMNRRGA